MTSTGVPSDIVPGTHDIALGEGWYPAEQYLGATFRWVENDAVILIAALRPIAHTLRVVVEPGPGVGLQPFELSARIVDGPEIGSALVASKQVVLFRLPPESPRVFSVALHASGGGQSSPNDPRVLNFRVFEAIVERAEDVFPAWAVPTHGFYPLERHAGSVFRWVTGEATVSVFAFHDDTLSFEAESGPGRESKPFRLDVLDPEGAVLSTVQIGSRTLVRIPLTSLKGAATLTLRAEGGGRSAIGDPRTLDFRVFAPG